VVDSASFTPFRIGVHLDPWLRACGECGLVVVELDAAALNDQLTRFADARTTQWLTEKPNKPLDEVIMSKGWCVLETFASGLDADIAIARLESEDIPAMRDDNDSSGIFGANFQGATARGVTVRVPEEALEAAREVLQDMSGDDE
jgi:hypothetical protein